MTGGLRNTHNDEIHNCYLSSSTVKTIKLRGVAWVKHVACVQNFGQKT